MQKFIPLVGIVTVLCSCEIHNPPEPIPAYIQIDSFSLQPNQKADAGSLSHDIEDAWVFVDDNLIGVYDIPAKIPILESGRHKLTIAPGILVSTVSTLRENYLFYTAYTDPNFDMITGEVQAVTPVVTYRDSLGGYRYLPIDDFEGPFPQLDSFSGSQVPIVLTSNASLVFEGKQSGLVNIGSNDSVVFIKTPNYELPQQGKTVYMELNYYSDYPVTIGMYVNNLNTQNQIIDYLTLNPTTDDEEEERWKKAYVELTSIVSGATNPNHFFAYFQVRVDEPSNRKEGRFMIDNVKFLHQK